jgi:hypothetical protein
MRAAGGGTWPLHNLLHTVHNNQGRYKPSQMLKNLLFYLQCLAGKYFISLSRAGQGFTLPAHEHRRLIWAAPPHLHILLLQASLAQRASSFLLHSCGLAARWPVFSPGFLGCIREGAAVTQDCIQIDDMLPRSEEQDWKPVTLASNQSKVLCDIEGPRELFIRF